MVRKTDEELLAELKKKRKDPEEEEETEYKAEPYNEDEEAESEENKKTAKVQTQVIEREINLSLINDKLNFIISQLQKK